MSNDVLLPGTGANVETIEQGGTGTTNGTTASGNATLHFAATPAFVSAGMLIADTTAPTVIPANTTVLSFTGTTVVMSANATGAGVGGTDTIIFSAQRQVVAAFSKITDGTNIAAVKPASTAPLATDPAVVVSISPNSINANVPNNADAQTPGALAGAPVVSYSYGYNGTTWDRLQVDASKNLKVAGPTTDNGPAWTSVWGVAGVPITTATTFSTTAATDAPTSTQHICVDDILFSCDAATKLTLLEETSGTVLFGPWYFPANSLQQITLRGKKKLATADKKLVATMVGSANASLHVGYHSEP